LVAYVKEMMRLTYSHSLCPDTDADGSLIPVEIMPSIAFHPVSSRRAVLSVSLPEIPDSMPAPEREHYIGGLIDLDDTTTVRLNLEPWQTFSMIC
jgi:hypothetical protein